MQTYQPAITPEHHTCVGLGLTLLNKLASLDNRFPGLASRVHLLSCEEAVDHVESYVADSPDPLIAEKEHVLVGVRLDIAGRKGFLLLDPGYHVARVVTVMEDRMYPHTGWFMQSSEGQCRKDYDYKFSEERNYIVWRVKERRGDAPAVVTHSPIYVARPFLSPVDVTERRNLVYNFRSLLNRNTKGHVKAGIYFPIKENGAATFTVFYEENEVKKREKMNFSDFKTFPNALDEKQLAMVEECSRQLGFETGRLYDILHDLALVVSDKEFVRQMLLINEKINNMADSN